MERHKALFYQRKDNNFIDCQLCPHHCQIKEGNRGRCGVREAVNKELYALNYGLCAAVALDPIEKKPLYHFYPGRSILSLGTWGCNLNCSFCQNWSLARGEIPYPKESLYKSPAAIIALLEKEYPFSVGIAYTYNEPTVWYEYVLDTAKLVSSGGYKNVLVSNGYINPKALNHLLPHIHAINIDVKAFSDGFYKKYCGGDLQTVKESVEICAGKCHLEVTYLVIPSLNDSLGEVENFSRWLAAIDPSIPVHFSRYFPNYKFNLPPTPLESLTRIREKALEKLHYVYVGNLGADNSFADTSCPFCHKTLISRSGFAVNFEGIGRGKKCRSCGKEIEIFGEW